MRTTKLLLLIVLSLLCLVRINAQNQISNNIFEYNGFMGIGKSLPAYFLDIESDASYYNGIPSQFIHLQNNNDSDRSNVAINFESGTSWNNAMGSIGVTAYSYTGNPNLSGFTYLFSPNEGIALRANNSNGIIKFLTGGNQIENERLRISHDGNIGIGTTTPEAKVEIKEGDIYLNSVNYGVIMKSPDGNCWRGTLDNTGNITFNPIDCPNSENSINSYGNTDTHTDVFPNPTSERVSIRTDKDLSNGYLLLLNSSGQLMHNSKISTEIISFNLSSYAAGTYIIQLYDSNSKLYDQKKITKQ